MRSHAQRPIVGWLPAAAALASLLVAALVACGGARQAPRAPEPPSGQQLPVLVAELPSDPIVEHLAFDDRAATIRPELDRAFAVSIAPTFDRGQVLWALDVITRASGGRVGFVVDDPTREPEIRIVSELVEFNGVPFWGGLCYPNAQGGLLRGGKVNITPPAPTDHHAAPGEGPVFPPLLIHELGHCALGVGHTALRDAEYIQGSAGWLQRDFHPREVAAITWLLSQPPGIRHPRRDVGKASAAGPFVCRMEGR